MFNCPLHNWYSHESPCPACQIVQDASGGEDVVFYASQSPIPTKEWLEQKAKDPGTPNPPVLFEVWDKDNSQAPTKEGLEERAEKWADLISNKNGLYTSLKESWVHGWVKEAYIAGAQSSLQPSSPDPTVLVQALRDIIEMKLEPGEKDYKYAFNRCWHIATKAINKE